MKEAGRGGGEYVVGLLEYVYLVRVFPFPLGVATMVMVVVVLRGIAVGRSVVEPSLRSLPCHVFRRRRRGGRGGMMMLMIIHCCRCTGTIGMALLVLSRSAPGSSRRLLLRGLLEESKED